MAIAQNLKSGFLLGLSLLLSVLFLTACDSPTSGTAVFRNIGRTGQPNGSEKISEKTPPLYNTQYWKVGSYWVWKERKAPKIAKCIRWTIAELSTAGGVTIEQKITQDCKSYEGVKANHFHFFPSTGEVDSSDYSGIKEGSKIFNFLYGEDKVKSYYRLPVKLPWGGKLTVYRIEGEQAWYLDAQQTLLQGTLWQNNELQLLEYFDSHSK